MRNSICSLFKSYWGSTGFIRVCAHACVWVCTCELSPEDKYRRCWNIVLGADRDLIAQLTLFFVILPLSWECKQMRITLGQITVLQRCSAFRATENYLFSFIADIHMKKWLEGNILCMKWIYWCRVIVSPPMI